MGSIYQLLLWMGINVVVTKHKFMDLPDNAHVVMGMDSGMNIKYKVPVLVNYSVGETTQLINETTHLTRIVPVIVLNQLDGPLTEISDIYFIDKDSNKVDIEGDPEELLTEWLAVEFNDAQSVALANYMDEIKTPITEGSTFYIMQSDVVLECTALEVHSGAHIITTGKVNFMHFNEHVPDLSRQAVTVVVDRPELPVNHYSVVPNRKIEMYVGVFTATSCLSCQAYYYERAKSVNSIVDVDLVQCGENQFQPRGYVNTLMSDLNMMSDKLKVIKHIGFDVNVVRDENGTSLFLNLD